MHATCSRDIAPYHPLPYNLIVLTITVLSMKMPKISRILTNSRSYKHYHKSKAYQKRGRSEYNLPEVLIHDLLRGDLHNYLRTY